jgi:hypothetical protein
MSKLKVAGIIGGVIILLSVIAAISWAIYIIYSETVGPISLNNLFDNSSWKKSLGVGLLGIVILALLSIGVYVLVKKASAHINKIAIITAVICVALALMLFIYEISEIIELSNDLEFLSPEFIILVFSLVILFIIFLCASITMHFKQKGIEALPYMWMSFGVLCIIAGCFIYTKAHNTNKVLIPNNTSVSTNNEPSNIIPPADIGTKNTNKNTVAVSISFVVLGLVFIIFSWLTDGKGDIERAFDTAFAGFITAFVCLVIGGLGLDNKIDTPEDVDKNTVFWPITACGICFFGITLLTIPTK